MWFEKIVNIRAFSLIFKPQRSFCCSSSCFCDYKLRWMYSNLRNIIILQIEWLALSSLEFKKPLEISRCVAQENIQQLKQKLSVYTFRHWNKIRLFLHNKSDWNYRMIIYIATRRFLRIQLFWCDEDEQAIFKNFYLL